MDTSARAALTSAVGLALAAVAVAVVVIPWDAAVAPWAALALPNPLTADQTAAIADYVSSAWLPGFLSWIAVPAAAVTIACVPRVRAWLTGLASNWPSFAGDVVRGATLLLLVRISALPFQAWLAVVRREHDLLLESWWAWAARWLLETGAFVGLGALALAAALVVLRRWPRRGWIAVVAGAVVVTAVGAAALPLMQRVDGTVADPALTARVMELADRLGIEVGQVTVVSMSDRAPVVNANVSGWGPTRTVTIFDTVGQQASPAEIDALVVHELIHARENDVLIGTLLACLGAGSAAALAACAALTPAVRRRLCAASPGDWRVAPAVVAILLVAGLVGSVAAANASRALEARTDREAVAVTGDPQAYADLMLLLATANKSTLEPSRWRYALLFTHPTPLQRWDAALRLSRP